MANDGAAGVDVIKFVVGMSDSLLDSFWDRMESNKSELYVFAVKKKESFYWHLYTTLYKIVRHWREQQHIISLMTSGRRG